MNPFRHDYRSETDDADQALNAWISNTTPKPVSDMAARTLDTHRKAMSAVRTDPAASGPAAGTWNKVLRATAQPKPKGNEEMTAITLGGSIPASSSGWTESKKGRLSRFTTIAATLAVVSLLAFGGWFAAMNLQPGDNGGQLAMTPGTTSASATCDVEPMTVDEVMAIAENPYSYISSDMYPAKTDDWRNSREQLRDVYPMTGTSLNPGYGEIPTTTAMNDAMAMLDVFMACMQEHGTVAYMLRFSDPFSIQDQVRQQFPFYREEGKVREYVDTWLRTISVYSSPTAVFDGKELNYAPNGDRENATRYLIELGLGFDQLLFIGSDVMDQNGELYTVLPVWHVNVTNTETRPGLIFSVVHSRYSDQWYVVTGSWLYSAMYG